MRKGDDLVEGPRPETPFERDTSCLGGDTVAPVLTAVAVRQLRPFVGLTLVPADKPTAPGELGRRGELHRPPAVTPAFPLGPVSRHRGRRVLGTIDRAITDVLHRDAVGFVGREGIEIGVPPRPENEAFGG